MAGVFSGTTHEICSAKYKVNCFLFMIKRKKRREEQKGEVKEKEKERKGKEKRNEKKRMEKERSILHF